MGWPRRRRSIFDIFDEFFREFEERFARIEEDMERELRRSIEEGKGEIRGPYVYGFKITIGPDGVPKIEEFGNVSGRRGRPRIEEEMEPLVDVIERDDEIWIIADLPGVPMENIDVKVTEKTVTIRASNDRKYYKVINLPAEVIPESSKASYRNGVLEIKLKRKGSPKEEGFKVTIE